MGAKQLNILPGDCVGWLCRRPGSNPDSSLITCPRWVLLCRALAMTFTAWAMSSWESGGSGRHRSMVSPEIDIRSSNLSAVGVFLPESHWLTAAWETPAALAMSLVPYSSSSTRRLMTPALSLGLSVPYSNRRCKDYGYVFNFNARKNLRIAAM